MSLKYVTTLKRMLSFLYD